MRLLAQASESILPIVVMDSGLDAAHRPGMTNVNALLAINWAKIAE
jgi:hypothetical protein